MVRCNVFIISLCVVQLLITMVYQFLAGHAGYGMMQKLDEARQAQADKEAALREPTPEPQEYEYGQPDLPFMFDMNMYTYLGMCLTMTYLRKYAYTSLGMSFLMGCLAQEWCCLLLQWIPLAHCSQLKQMFVKVGCPYGNNPELTQFENFQRGLSCTCVSLDGTEGVEQPLELRITDFIKGQYGVVAVLVSYGALLGKVNPQQMMLIVVVNVTAYCANKFLCVDYRGGVDNTGSLYTTHIFGASFGLGCAMIVSGKRPSENPDNSPRYQSNNYAILGSLFMFVTYPSFNSYWAPDVLRVFVATVMFSTSVCARMLARACEFYVREHIDKVVCESTKRATILILSLVAICTVLGYSHAQRPAKQNQSTFAALMAGGMFSFIWANLLYPEGPTVMHLQDGVLAAGVAASTPACMFIDPVGMMLVGAGGTLVATLSFRFIQPKIADQDTQGVTSLHLLPGLWGALVMQAVTLAGIDRNWITLRNAEQLRVVMPHYSGGNDGQLISSATQALVTGFSIFVGGISGALTGLVAKFTGRIALGGSYSDHVFWIVPDDFTHIGEEGADIKVM